MRETSIHRTIYYILICVRVCERERERIVENCASRRLFLYLYAMEVFLRNGSIYFNQPLNRTREIVHIRIERIAAKSAKIYRI